MAEVPFLLFRLYVFHYDQCTTKARRMEEAVAACTGFRYRFAGKTPTSRIITPRAFVSPCAYAAIRMDSLALMLSLVRSRMTLFLSAFLLQETEDTMILLTYDPRFRSNPLMSPVSNLLRGKPKIPEVPFPRSLKNLF
ncbi:MAG: hypothetical protein IJL88_14655 [Clostridia bacterium]|nr:hypothetical protein [Clostridia bacterium]